jgi:bifunctional polynucleotide phosphatase/kinase
MSSPKENPVFKFFEKRAEKDIVCLVPGCKKPGRTSYHAGNLRAHLKAKHREQFQLIEHLSNTKADSESSEENRDVTFNNSLASASNSLEANGSSNSSLQPPTKKRRLSIEITERQVVDACVEMVTVNGRPFKALSDSGFRKILDPILKGFGGTFTISPENIRDKVEGKAKEIRVKIKKDVKNRFVSVKMDCATRLDRALLGINLQFNKKGKIQLYTLAIIEMKQSHTAVNFKQNLLDVFGVFGIKLWQVYSLTTDNGANMLKASRILAQTDSAESDEEEDSDYNDRLLEEELIRRMEEGQNVSDEGGEESAELQNMLQGVRCAAHTLQLAILDALAEPGIAVIAKARAVCKTLRSQTFMAAIRLAGQKKPIIDCLTRWCSTCLMLERLIELKEFIAELTNEGKNQNLKLTEQDWSRIEDIIKILKPARILTTVLQSEQLTIGDFYGSWLKCQLEISKFNSSFAKNLLKHMKKRLAVLLTSEVVLAALYLDPR